VQLLATGQLLSLREDKVQLLDSDSSEDEHLSPTTAKEASAVGKQAESKDNASKSQRGKFQVGQKLWLQKKNSSQYDGVEVFVLPSDPLKVLEDQVTVQLPTGKRIVVKASHLSTVPPKKPQKKRKAKSKATKEQSIDSTAVAQPAAAPAQVADAVANPAAVLFERRPQEPPVVIAATIEPKTEEKEQKQDEAQQPAAPAPRPPTAPVPAAATCPAPPAEPAAAAAAAVQQKPKAVGTSSIEEWCKDNGICDELIARLQDEEVETAEDLACIMDEDLNALAHGIKIGKKAKLLNAVRKLRQFLGIERAPKENGES